MIFLIVEKVISVVFLPSGSAPPYSYRAPPPPPRVVEELWFVLPPKQQ